MFLKVLPVVIFFCGRSASATPIHITPQGDGSLKIEIDLTFDGQARRFQLDTGADKSMVVPDGANSSRQFRIWRRPASLLGRGFTVDPRR